MQGVTIMKYNTLGNTGLNVSAISMGTFSFGGSGPFGMIANQGVSEAKRLTDLCIDHGVNVFDTANMYSTGLSEEIVGEVLGDKSDDILLTSKVRMRIGDGPNDEGASRWHIIRECERSLKRLRRDHIDIYYIHEWDGQSAVEEQMAALDMLVQQGKVRYIGCSNYSGWHVMKSQAAAQNAGSVKFSTQQIHYTLEAREAEYELLPLSVDQNMGVLVWSPLAAGLLTGKHQRGMATPDGTRQAAGWTEPPIKDKERLWKIVDCLGEIAKIHNATPAQVALAWLLTRPAISSLVVGGRNEAQFTENFGAITLTLSDEDLQRLNDVSRIPLLYPYWHQHNFARPRFSDADQALHADYPDRQYGGDDSLI
jgi:aryl-alcohol dehydrogenase-like predicted oxidoreductase